MLPLLKIYTIPHSIQAVHSSILACLVLLLFHTIAIYALLIGLKNMHIIIQIHTKTNLLMIVNVLGSHADSQLRAICVLLTDRASRWFQYIPVVIENNKVWIIQRPRGESFTALCKLLCNNPFSDILTRAKWKTLETGNEGNPQLAF